uniref:HMG box domain-containing protein n=1 Tax=viral metagenome TaxID=1070528 RepID=A0A6C0KDC5_9ZZZZ
MSAKIIETAFKDLFAAVQKKFTTQEDLDLSIFDEMVKDASTLLSKKLKNPEKAKKDPNAPKRPLGSYMLFCKDKRETDNVKDAKKLGEMWKELSEGEKQVYKDKAKKLLDDFKLGTSDEEEKGEIVPKKSKKNM